MKGQSMNAKLQTVECWSISAHTLKSVINKNTVPYESSKHKVDVRIISLHLYFSKCIILHEIALMYIAKLPSATSLWSSLINVGKKNHEINSQSLRIRWIVTETDNLKSSIYKHTTIIQSAQQCPFLSAAVWSFLDEYKSQSLSLLYHCRRLLLHLIQYNAVIFLTINNNIFRIYS